MILVDTGAWYAEFVSDDEYHAQARAFVDANRAEAFLATDYVVTEDLNLLVVRGYPDRARDAAPAFFAGQTARLEWVRREDIDRALEVFVRFADKR